MNRIQNISSVVPKRSVKLKTVHQHKLLATNAFVVPTHPNKSHLHPTHVPPSPALPTTQEYLDRANSYILPVYARPEIVLSKNKGAYVWDVEGKRYLDFCAGIAVNSLGGGDSGVLKVSFKSSLIYGQFFCWILLSALISFAADLYKHINCSSIRNLASVMLLLY